jgi:hypothetical protein
LVRNVMRAYVEGIHYYKTHRAESIAILAKYLKTSDDDVLAEVYDDIGLRLTAAKPYPTLRGIGIMLREIAASTPKTATARPEDFVDLTFVKELDASGFIDRLYKSTSAIAKQKDQPSRSSPSNVKASEPQSPGQPKAPVVAAKPRASEDGSREHIVVAGDTLSHIALAYYGNSHKWEAIYLANQTTMRNPHYLYIGQKIFIPS